MVNEPETPRQREVVGGWLKTFCTQTGVDAVHVYIAPWDEPAVEANRLPFYPFKLGSTTPRQDLAELQFDAIKIRSFRGSLRGVLDASKGLPAYLGSVQSRAREYAQVRESLCRMNYSDRLDLPPFPPQLLMDEIWNWLASRRRGTTFSCHGIYMPSGRRRSMAFRKVRAGVTQLAGGVQGEAEQDEMLLFHKREWDCLRIAVARWLDRLDEYRRVGSELLKVELAQALSVVDRQHLFDELERALRDADDQRVVAAIYPRGTGLVRAAKSAIGQNADDRDTGRGSGSAGGDRDAGIHGGPRLRSNGVAWAVNWFTDFTAGAAGAAVGEAAAVKGGQLALKPLIRRSIASSTKNGPKPCSTK